MKANHDLKRNAQVLRDIALNAKPHVLERPKRSLTTKFPVVESSRIEQLVKPVPLQVYEGLLNISASSVTSTANIASAIAAPDVQAIDRFAEGRQEGRSEGVREGVAKGREEALKEYECTLEIERTKLFEQAVQDGLQQGIAQGHAQGVDQGFREAEQRIESRIVQLSEEIKNAAVAKQERFDQVVVATSAAMSQILENSEDQLLEICFSFICKVLGEQMTSREGLLASLRHHMQSMNEQNLQIGLCQEDLAMLRGGVSESDISSEEELQISPGKSVTFYVAPEVKLGGFVFRAKELTLEARLEDQLALLRNVLVQNRRENGMALALNRRVGSGEPIEAKVAS